MNHRQYSDDTFARFLWCLKQDDDRCLIITNFSDKTSQALAKATWDELRGRT